MKKLKIKVCEYCGYKFRQYVANQKFCSQTCGERYRYEKDLESGRKKPEKYSNCLVCGKRFKRKMDKHVFCSKVCRKESRRISGLNHELREYVLEKFNFTCQGCGLLAHSPEELHVHHITPLYKGGADIESNLETLCVVCHKKAHGVSEEAVE